jgi:hypothetical protein
MLLPHNIDSTGSNLRVLAHNGHAGSEGAVYTENNGVCLWLQNGQVEVDPSVITPTM